MSDLITAAPASFLDPDQRVKYSLGLVLGVDEFEQEQFYFLERDRLHQRALHGYGTICGLNVATDGVTVSVSPGVAVSPRGAAISVPCSQCADLDEWLGVPEHQQAVTKAFGAPSAGAPRQVTLYVLLRYDERDEQQVYLPGAPCRSADDTLAYSRVAERFELRFSLEPPARDDEAVVERFGELLGAIVVADGPGPFLSVAQIEARVQKLASEPLPGGETLMVRPLDAPAVLRAALRVWVSEVRPQFHAKAEGCVAQPPPERELLLGRLDFAVDETWQVVRPSDPAQKPVDVDQSGRPLLLHARLLQELLLRMAARQGPASKSLIAPRRRAGGEGGAVVVAAGRFDGAGGSAGAPLFSFNGLTASRQADPTLYLLAFPGYTSGGSYVVKGVPCAEPGGKPVTLEALAPDDPRLAALHISPDSGIAVRVMQIDDQPATGGFMVEISQFQV